MHKQDLVRTHSFTDAQHNFRAFITIDDLTLGPALGGIRMRQYVNLDEARADVARLAHTMTLKGAIALHDSLVPLGGGKMVVVGNPETDKGEALYRFVGECINSLNGAYIAACDIGWNPADLIALSRHTPHVAGLPRGGDCGDDTAEMTALGGLAGIQASLGHSCGVSDVRGFWFTIQGVGNVGRRLAQHLYRSGARVFVCDLVKEKLQELKRLCPRDTAQVIAHDAMFRPQVDVFAPCATGGVLTEEVIERLARIGVWIVAGLANNQPAEPQDKHAQRMHEKSILYAPDFVINAGGIINCAATLDPRGYDRERVKEDVLKIGPRLRNIFARAAAMM